jgi:cytochrome c biogenesis protein CcdA
MVAAVNPCGFALLPAYLGLYLGASTSERFDARSIGPALAVGGTMTASFVALFGLIGLALGAATALLGDILPWLSVIIGVLLTLVGGKILSGATLSVPLAARLGDRLGAVAKRPRLIGYAAYGAAFALSSLGCTLPLFLSVVATGLTADGLGAAATHFALYGLGMGMVVTSATVVVSLFGRALVARAGTIGRLLSPASAVLLIASGAYVVYYWLTVGGLLG